MQLAKVAARLLQHGGFPLQVGQAVLGKLIKGMPGYTLESLVHSAAAAW
jgi:hypothetical protein